MPGNPKDSRGTAPAEAKAPGNSSEAQTQDPKIQAQVQELVQIQNKVISHEQAHMAAGGELAGGANYSYTTGPDGKRYITGGEVAIHTPAVKEPEEKIRVMRKVQAAAMAPADPSPQDLRVASGASAAEAQARMELARQKAEQAYGGGKGRKESAEGITKPDGQRPDRAARDGTAAQEPRSSGAVPKGSRLNLTV